MSAEILKDLATVFNRDRDLYLFSDVDIGSIDKLPSCSSLSTHPDELLYPFMSPKIISDSKLSPNDSFNQLLPPIPSQSKSKPNPNKKAVNQWYSHNLNTNTLPYIRPPSIFIEQSVSHDTNDTPLCISPRNHIKNRRESHLQIPDFGGGNEINIGICGKCNCKPRNKRTR
eukprot:UN00250